LILGDFGTGKTFLLQQLARLMGTEAGVGTPILIQMRALEKGHGLDTLVAMHLAQAGMERIELKAFRYMLEQGRIALLFDGFDELALRVTYSRAAEHLRTLIEAASGDARVVVTSRTQHFLSEQQIKTALYEQVERLPNRRIVSLEPFDTERIHRFLVNRLRDARQAGSRLQLLDQIKDLLGLSANPRMLSFIVELSEEDLRQAKARDGKITAASLYRLLLERWLIGEYERLQPTGAVPALSPEDRWQAATDLALCLWRKTDTTVNIDELTETVTRTITNLPALQLQPDQAAHQVGSGTLLVRDGEGGFGFIHQSVLEWLVANQAAQSLRTGTRADVLTTRPLSPLMADFLSGLAGWEATIAWAQQMLAAVDASEHAKQNALLVLERLGVQAQQELQLAGEDLRGQDLSHRDLSYANLTGADLREARLIGSDMRHTVLTNALLVSADLSQALLNGAHVQHADLSKARLLGADLRGAQLSGSVLRRGKLVGACLDTGVIEGCDHFGYAPPQPEHIAALVASASACNAIIWSPDGDWIASGHEGGSLRLWEVASGLEIQRLQGHQGSVRSVAFSPDGRLLASGAIDKPVRLWDVAVGREQAQLSGHQDQVWSVAFSPDSRLLASGAGDNTVRLWDVATGACYTILVHLPEGWVAYTPDGRYKLGGDISGSFWHVIGLCRFEPGELDPYLPTPLRLPDDAILVPAAPREQRR
jgi:WD domain, G-beta repeat/NACHT domain/Pentapeptide repeats (8 copies)